MKKSLLRPFQGCIGLAIALAVLFSIKPVLAQTASNRAASTAATSSSVTGETTTTTDDGTSVTSSDTDSTNLDQEFSTDTNTESTTGSISNQTSSDVISTDLSATATKAVVGVVFAVWVIFILAIYLYSGITLMLMAKKTNTENAWMAWVPIANLFLTLMVAAKPLWWFLLMLIPGVNLIILLIVWMAISERLGKPSWVALLMLVPIVGIAVPGYLAFSKDTASGSVGTATAAPSMLEQATATTPTQQTPTPTDTTGLPGDPNEPAATHQEITEIPDQPAEPAPETPEQPNEPNGQAQ